MATVRITESVTLEEAELEERFVRSSGPGGQNVNKVSTAVELRFDVRSSPSLPGEVRVRLERLAGRRLTDEGVLVIQAQSHRTQDRNREDARERLFELIRQACVVPKRRIKTKPPRASKERRRESKAKRSHVKKLRGAKPDFS
jgi:ribosome-associated protein